jgi:DNA-binding CsgD family transcriptional regulator
MTWASFPDRELAEQVCSPRQLQVLERIERGMTLREIALALDVSVSTVRSHKRDALDNICRAKRRAA